MSDELQEVLRVSDPRLQGAPLVGILVGSASDLPVMQQATAILQRLEEVMRRTHEQHLRRPELSQHFLREHAVPHVLRHISWPPGALVAVGVR